MNLEDESFIDNLQIRAANFNGKSADLIGGNDMFEFRMGCLGNPILVDTQYVFSIKEIQSN